MELSFITDESFRGFAERLIRSYFVRGVQLDLRRLLQLGDEHYQNRFSEGGLPRPLLYDLLQAAYNLYLLQCFQAVSSGPIASSTSLPTLASWCKDFNHDLSLLPTHTIRDGKKIDYQQFSTPPTLALLVAYAAGLRPDDVVLEPSAGLAGLIVMTRLWGVRKVVANEVEDSRRHILDQLLRYYEKGVVRSKVSVEGRDAGKLHLTASTMEPTVIIMNPPFSIDQGTENPMTAAEHIKSALKVLATGGRLVAILPGGQDGRYADGEDASHGMLLRSGGRYGKFWAHIQSQYTVRCDIGIKGEVFQKFGTTYRTRLVIIDKIGPQQRGYVPLRPQGDWFTPEALFGGACTAFHRVVGLRALPLNDAQKQQIEQEMDDRLFEGGSAHKLRKHIEAGEEPEPVDESSVEEVVEEAPAPAPATPPEVPPLEIRQLQALGQMMLNKPAAAAAQGLSIRLGSKSEPAQRERFVHRDQVDLQYKGKLGHTYNQVSKLLYRWGINNLLFVQPAIKLVLKIAALGEEVIVETNQLRNGTEAALAWTLSITHYSYKRQTDNVTSVFFDIDAGGALGLAETCIVPHEGDAIEVLNPDVAKELVNYLVDAGFDEAEIESSEGLPVSGEGADDLDAFLNGLGVHRTPDPAPQNGTVGGGVVVVPANRGEAGSAKESQWHSAPEGEYEEGEVIVTAPINIVPDRELDSTDAGGDMEDVFQLYEPFAQIANSVPHNVPLVESSTMRMVNMPIATAPVFLPKIVVESGALSSMQLENVIYAAHNHAKFLPDTLTPTAFFCGDGTGTGKGRSGAAIIMHNDYLLKATEGRRVRALWVTKEFSLVEAARKDWHELGGDRDFVHSHSPMREQTIGLKDGIIVSTYSTMRMEGNEQDKVEKSEEEVQAEWDAYELRAQQVEEGRKVRKEWVAYVKRYGHRDLYPSEASAILLAGGVLPVEGELTMPTIPAAKKPREEKPSVNRLRQIVEWDPDVIVFDESHLMGNAVGKGKARGGTSSTSQRGLMGLKLLEELPRAKVVFESATGATELHNLGYSAERLGLCGKHVAAFPNIQDFIAKIMKGGMLGLELVAKDMKAAGVYRATNISYAGTSFELLEHKLTRNQRKLYDDSTYFWRLALDCIRKAFELNDTNSQGMAAIMSQFWGAAQRFYNQILISMQAPTAIAYAVAQMKAGHSVVVQLVNTNEAATERAVGDALAHESNLDDLDITPKDTLAQLIKQSFPTLQYEAEKDEDGALTGKFILSRDANGEPFQNPDAVRLRDRLLQQINEMRAPQGALDMFLERCAEEGFPMAEITGRKQRYLMKSVPVEGSETGEVMMMRHSEPRSKELCDAEAALFMQDELRGLIFSDAGNTGRSFQSDLRSKNQRRRIHIVLQPGWRADNAIQGMGRTHRTNQRVPPHYVLTTTELPGQKRFVTSIARRIEQLGSLTKGNRRAANSGLFSDTDNLETKYALQAMHQIFYTLWMDHNASFREAIGASFYELQDLMGLNLVDDSVDPPQLRKRSMTELTMVRFLNRLLLLPTKLQERLFSVFESLHETIVENAKSMGTFDRGVEKITAQSIIKLSDKLVYTDPTSGSRTRIVKLKVTRHRDIVNFEEMLAGKYVASNERGWNMQQGEPLAFIMTSGGRICSVWDAGQGTTRDGSVTKMLRLVSPESTERMSTEEYGKRKDMQIDKATAKINWDGAVRGANAFNTREVILVTGAILPVWDRLGDDTTRDGARIYVAETTATATDPGERIIGREIATKNLEAVLRNLGVVGKDALRLSSAEMLTRVFQQTGTVLHLSNKWRIQRRRMANNAHRLALSGPGCNVGATKDFPFVSYEMDGRDPVFILDMPADQKQRIANLEAITRKFPVVQLYQGGVAYEVANVELEEALKLSRQDELPYFPADHLVDWQETIMAWPPEPFDLKPEQEQPETMATESAMPTAAPVESVYTVEAAEDIAFEEVEEAPVPAPVPVLDDAARALTKEDVLRDLSGAIEPEEEPEEILTEEEQKTKALNLQQQIEEVMRQYPRGSVRNRKLAEVYGQMSLF
jgi:hypothetical protein